MRGPSLFTVGILLFFLPVQQPVEAQDGDASTGDILGGATLGAYSGTMLGLVGGIGICNRTLAGARCPRIAATLGGAIGATSGVVMAMEKDGSIQGRWRGAGYGALIGGIVGFGLSQGVRQYHLADVGAFTAVGAAFGASPKGAGIGLGVGAFLGSLSWMVYPKITVGDAVAISLAGLAAGGLAGWVLGAEKEPTDFPPLIPFQIRF